MSIVDNKNKRKLNHIDRYQLIFNAVYQRI